MFGDIIEKEGIYGEKLKEEGTEAENAKGGRN